MEIANTAKDQTLSITPPPTPKGSRSNSPSRSRRNSFEKRTSLDLAQPGFGTRFENRGRKNSLLKEIVVPSELLYVLRGHYKAILDIFVDNAFVYSASLDRTIRSWNTETTEPAVLFIGHESYVDHILVVGALLFSSSGDGTVRVWDKENGNCLKVLRGHETYVRDLKLYQDEKGQQFILSGSSDHSIRMWDVKTFRCVRVFQTGDPIVQICVDIKQRILFACCRDGSITAWDIAFGGLYVKLGVLKAHKDTVWQLLVYGNYLFSCGWDSEIIMWDIKTLSVVHSFIGHSQHVYCMFIKNEVLYTGSGDWTARSWDLMTGKPIMKFMGHKGSIECIIVHNDVLYTASSDSTIRLWNPKTGDKISVYKGHKSYITKLVVLDKVVFTAGFDSFVGMWNSQPQHTMRPLSFLNAFEKKPSKEEESQVKSLADFRSGGKLAENLKKFSDSSPSLSAMTPTRKPSESEQHSQSKLGTSASAPVAKTNNIISSPPKTHEEKEAPNKKLKRSLSDDLLRDANISKHLDPSLNVNSNPLFGKQKQLKEVKHTSVKTQEEIKHIVQSKSHTGANKHPTVTTNPLFGKKKEIEYVREKRKKIIQSKSASIVETKSFEKRESIDFDIYNPFKGNSRASSPRALRVEKKTSISTNELLQIISDLEKDISRKESTLQRLKQMSKPSAKLEDIFRNSPNVSRSSFVESPKSSPKTGRRSPSIGTGLAPAKLPSGSLASSPKSRSLPDLYNRSLLGCPELLDFIQEGDQEEVLKCLEQMNPSEINSSDENGMGALHWSTRLGNKDITKILLKVKGIKVNNQDSLGWTPLHYAANGGYKDIVAMLLQNKSIDVNIKNHHRQTAQDVSKSKEIVAILKIAKKKRKLKSEKGRMELSSSALFKASEYSTDSVVRQLEQKNFTQHDLAVLKKESEVLEIQEKNEKLEGELHKIVGNIGSDLFIEEDEDKYF